MLIESVSAAKGSPPADQLWSARVSPPGCSDAEVGVAGQFGNPAAGARGRPKPVRDALVGRRWKRLIRREQTAVHFLEPRAVALGVDLASHGGVKRR